MEHYFTNNENLKSELREVKYNHSNYSFNFYSDLGVFSKNKIDYASSLLVEEYLKLNSEKKKVLDVGCGYGFIGLVISKVTNSEVTMIDINKRAVHLTNMNIKEMGVNANAFVSDVYENINDKYDVIITNPPIRAGKEKVMSILIGAKEHLNDNGELWFVINKNQGAKSTARELIKYYQIEVLEKSKGFYIFRAKTN